MPNQNAVAKVQEEPDFPPPNPSLDLTIMDKKCRSCKEPLFLNDSTIVDIRLDVNCDVLCTIKCKSCGYENDIESRYQLPFKSAPVQEFIRNFKSIDKPTISKAAKCKGCNEPSDRDINSIGSIDMYRDDEEVTISFNCKSCKKYSYDYISYKSESIQRFLLSLN